MTFIKTQKFDRKHRAVAPVIATILLVAIAVVGGTLIFSFSQGFFSEQQLTTPAALDQLIINGYDARDTSARIGSNGTSSLVDGSTVIDDGKLATNDEIWVYVQNVGSNDLNVVDVTFAGEDYDFLGTVATNGLYNLKSVSDATVDTDAALTPGEEALLIVSLKSDIKIGRAGLLVITTGSGEVTEKIQIGRQTG